MFDEAVVAISYTANQRAIERQREINGRAEVDEKNIEDVHNTGQFATTDERKRFLLVDSRTEDPDLPVFFIFCSDYGLSRLQTYKSWAFDGTFSITPQNMYQLYTINVLISYRLFINTVCLYFVNEQVRAKL